MPTHKEFTTILDERGEARLHARFETFKGQVREFVVQLEVFYRSRWRVVLRYDNAHGFAHRDRLNLKRSQRKEPLDLTYEESLTYAINDINIHWAVYVERFLRGEYP